MLGLDEYTTSHIWYIHLMLSSTLCEAWVVLYVGYQRGGSVFSPIVSYHV